LNQYNDVLAIASAKKRKVGKLTADQVRQIAETKMPNLNTMTIDSAQAMRDTARSIGVDAE